jgi:hypothetical protein
MRFGGIVLAAALVLGACSSDPAPKEPDPTKATTAATPVRAVPIMPAQASEDSPEGAAAFVKHYVDVFNYAAATGDVKELSRLSAPGCTGCQKYIDLYRDTYKAGGYYRGGDWKMDELQLQQEGSIFYITTPVEVEPGTFRESRKNRESTDPGEKTTVSFAVARAVPSWRVEQLGLGAVQ